MTVSFASVILTLNIEKPSSFYVPELFLIFNLMRHPVVPISGSVQVDLKNPFRQKLIPKSDF